MMRKNNNNNRNNMKHRSGGGGDRGRRGGYQGGSGGGNRGGNDSGNIQRQKHHATQQLGKYSDMARNAQINGDRVDVEYYLQHVDHYTRVLTDIAAIEAERHQHQREHQPARQEGHAPAAGGDDHGGDANASGGDDQGGDANASGNPEGAGDQQHQPRQQRQPRRQHYSAPASDNGAAEANSNTTDIPLPGSILPQI